MDANKIEKLKALALAATPGPWKWWTSNSHTRLSARGDGDVMYGETLYDGVNNIRVGHADAKFIEASNPAAALELIAEVERLRVDAERYRAIRSARHGFYAMDPGCIDYEGEQLDKEVDAAIARVLANTASKDARKEPA